MKLRALVEGFAIPATVAAILAKDTLVKISADRTVDAAGADDFVVGRLFKPAREAAGLGTVETRGKELIEIKADGAIAAGDKVKMSSASPAGTQRVKKWVSQTDAAPGDKSDSMFGVCWFGGADAATVEIIVF